MKTRRLHPVPSPSPAMMVVMASLLLLLLLQPSPSLGFVPGTLTPSSLRCTTPKYHDHARQHCPSKYHHGRHPLTPLPSTRDTDSGGGLTSSLSKIVGSETVSLVLGSLCLLALVVNRLITDPLYDSQSRTDIIGVIAGGGLLLNGLSLQDVTTREADMVALSGPEVEEVKVPSKDKDLLLWAADTYLQALPFTKSVLLVYRGETVLRKGVVGPTPRVSISSSAILTKAMTATPDPSGLSQETFIPDLQILPGRIEFPFLPPTTPAVLLQPLANNKALLILGCNKARSYSPRELASIKVVTLKLQTALMGPER